MTGADRSPIEIQAVGGRTNGTEETIIYALNGYSDSSGIETALAIAEKRPATSKVSLVMGTPSNPRYSWPYWYTKQTKELT